MSKSKRGTSFTKKSKDKWATFRQLLRKCEIVIEVLDARDLEGTRVRKLEHWAGRERLIKIANKIDLISDEKVKLIDKKEYLPISSKSNNKNKERRNIIDAILAKRKQKPRILIVGYPNVGKSTIINLLAGREVARATPTAGTTTNVQWIRLPEDILLIDSPGVFPEYEKRTELLRKGALNVEQLESFEFYALKVAQKCITDKELSKWIEKYFDIKLEDDNPEKLIEKIAKRRKLMLKGGILNINEASKLLLRAFSKAPIIQTI